MRVAYFLIHQSADYWVAPQNVGFTEIWPCKNDGWLDSKMILDYIYIHTGWWFQTRILFSISYMGCHPKPIDEVIFFKMSTLHHQADDIGLYIYIYSIYILDAHNPWGKYSPRRIRKKILPGSTLLKVASKGQVKGLSCGNQPIWINYNDLTATSLEIMVTKGNHPQMALIQVSEIL